MYALLAALVVLIHLVFVLFATLGGLLVLAWPRLAWLHVPTVFWAAFIEFTGGVCPLTPLENDLRSRAGLDAYSGDFIARYVFPALYPEGLTREVQVLLGLGVVVINIVIYTRLIRPSRTRR